MILYISDEEHEEDFGLPDVHVKQMKGQDMQIVFRQELQHMGAVSYIIVESGAVHMATWDGAAEALQIMKRIPLLLLIEDKDLTDTFIRRDNYDVMNRAHKDIRDMVQDWVQNCLLQDIETLNHTWIAVAGLTHGCGTTALAMHLAGYIHKQEQEVTVTERDNVFSQLASAYGWEMDDKDSYHWGGISYNHNLIDETVPFTIFDLGLMTPKSHAVWKQCQVKILVADGKPYRCKDLGSRLKQLREYPGDIILVFTFVPEAEKPALRKEYTSEQVRIWFAPLEPDLFETSDDYQELVRGYVKPMPAEKKPKKIIPFHLPKISVPKNKIMVGGIILLALCIGFGAAMTVQKRQETQGIQVAVESVPRMDFSAITRIRLMLAEESAGENTEVVQEPPAEGTEQTEEAAVTEASVMQPQGTDTPGLQHLEERQQNTQAPGTEAPATEAPVTEAPRQEVSVPLTPSLRGYQGQIYTGSQVITIMNKYAGQPVALHLITRSSDGWYNYSVGGSGLATASAVSSGTALVDSQCSFLCQVVQVNGEDVGLEFVQQ